MRGYVSARGRAELLDTLLAAQVALLALHTAGWLLIAVVGHGDLVRTVERGARVSRPILQALFVVGQIVFGAWAFRVCSNLTSLDSWRRRLQPDTAVVLSLVPVLSVVGVPLVARALWLDSDPTPPPAGRVRRTLALWWVALAVAGVCNQLKDDEGGVARALLSASASAAWLVAALVCLVVVRQVQHRQDEQALDFERRRAAPTPTAAALR
jgi:hypothetical protein